MKQLFFDARRSGDTAVLGLGNPVLGDDRVGLAVADEVRKLLESEPVPGVQVLESTRGGFELIDLLSGFRKAIIVDCLTVPDPLPGRVHRMSLGQAWGSLRLINPHEIGIFEAFALARELGIPMPDEVEIYGIEGADTSSFSEELTPGVKAAVPLVAQEIVRKLRAD